MRRIVIVGANGYVGKKICEQLIEAHDLLQVSSSPNSGQVALDLREPKNFDYDLLSSQDTVIFLAAISSPDFCRLNTPEAHAINVEGTKFFIREALLKQSRVVFFSSDLVFGACKGVADENTKPQPFSQYGEMKLEVETAFRKSQNFKVFRPSYIFSRHRFLSQLQDCASNGTALSIFHPIFRSAIHRDEVVSAIESIHLKWDRVSWSSINICGTRLVSRVEVAQTISSLNGLNCKIESILPHNEFYASRPPSIQMHSLYLRDLLGREPLSLQESLSREQEELRGDSSS